MKAVPLFFAAALAAAALMTGIYGVAATAATALAATITREETDRHSRNVAFAAKALRDSSEHREALPAP